MTDWTTVASLATAGGTLVLALATFASVRSANRSARVTERALLAGIRPVLVPSRLTDPVEKVGFIDGHWMRVEGQLVSIDLTDEAIYLSFTVRNVGNGIGVLDRWDLITGEVGVNSIYRDPSEFTRLSRDIYIPAGDMGFWQGAFRDPSEERFIEVRRAIEQRRGDPHRPAVRGPRGRAAHDQSLLADPRRRRPVADVGGPPLEPRPRRPSLTA